MERNWTQFHTPRNLVLALVGEVGELAELFQWRGEVACGCPGWSEKRESTVTSLDTCQAFASPFLLITILQSSNT